MEKNIVDTVKDGCVILEPRSVFDKGVVKYKEKENRLVYSYELLVESFIENWDMDYSDAIDWIEYNTIRALDYIENSPEIIYEEFWNIFIKIKHKKYLKAYLLIFL